MDTSSLTTRCWELSDQFTERPSLGFDTPFTRDQAPLKEIPFHQWTLPGGCLWAGFYRLDDQYLVRFPELVDFLISSNGDDVNAYPVPGVSQQTVEHLFSNQILPLVLSRQFKLVLHGSAVVLDDVAVAFLGPSGRGKSTLAASFATEEFQFLTDDGLQLEKIDGKYFVLPSHPSIRLWDDSRRELIPQTAQSSPPVDYTSKARLNADDKVVYCNERRSLKYIYFLGETDKKSISITSVTGSEAVIEIVKNSFLLDIEEKEMLSHQFKQLSALVQHPIFFRLDYPRRYEVLRKVREAIVTHAQD